MPPDLEFWLHVGVQTLTLFALIVGTIGLIVPVFPGLVINWLVILIYGTCLWLWRQRLDYLYPCHHFGDRWQCE